MKNLEIKEIGIKSAFKSTLYLTSIPLFLLGIVGILLTIIGVAIGNSALIGAGIPYIFMPILLIFIYGLFAILCALVYSKLAKKFGRLEIKVVDKDKEDIE
jgi:amino acid transporter